MGFLISLIGYSIEDATWEYFYGLLSKARKLKFWREIQFLWLQFQTRWKSPFANEISDEATRTYRDEERRKKLLFCRRRSLHHTRRTRVEGHWGASQTKWHQRYLATFFDPSIYWQGLGKHLDANALSIGILRRSKNPVDAGDKKYRQRAESLSLAGAWEEDWGVRALTPVTGKIGMWVDFADSSVIVASHFRR